MPSTVIQDGGAISLSVLGEGNGQAANRISQDAAKGRELKNIRLIPLLWELCLSASGKRRPARFVIP
jgi:hypothetical protein